MGDKLVQSVRLYTRKDLFIFSNTNTQSYKYAYQPNRKSRLEHISCLPLRCKTDSRKDLKANGIAKFRTSGPTYLRVSAQPGQCVWKRCRTSTGNKRSSSNYMEDTRCQWNHRCRLIQPISLPLPATRTPTSFQNLHGFYANSIDARLYRDSRDCQVIPEVRRFKDSEATRQSR